MKRLFEGEAWVHAANSPAKARQFTPRLRPQFTRIAANGVLAPPWSIAMNVTLKPFNFADAVARAGLTPTGQPLKSGKAVEGGGFQQAMSKALGDVSKSQNDATAMQREVQLDNPTVSLEQTMVAMQKAQIGFQATLQVRNRLVQAYSDIMGMQV
jgi:flagellar hook-basal body complex protein FliE